jgi:hypothetical protein
LSCFTISGSQRKERSYDRFGRAKTLTVEKESLASSKREGGIVSLPGIISDVERAMAKVVALWTRLGLALNSTEN